MDTLNIINDFLWTYVIIALLIGCAVYFTVRTKAVQFGMLREMWRIMLGRDRSSGDRAEGGLGSFHGFAISLGSRVGTGNLAGVASAIFVGGPGAVFWMWVMALFGAATAFVESTLAQLYKRRGPHGFYGGPAYYMESGLGRRWMGIIFSVLMVVTFGFANNILQSSTIIDSLNSTFGWDKIHVGVMLTVVLIAIVIGGVARISRVVSYMVPFMAIGYVLLALVIMAMYIDRIPDVLGTIFSSAFGIRQVGGGMVGAAIMQGIRRGLFSNEAGEGSAPNAAAIADTSHPVKQGLVQALGVFIDTILICSCTAVIIVMAGEYNGSADGIVLTLNSLEALMGPVAKYFVTAAILLFAFSTMLANCYYGETNIRFFTHRRWVMWIYWAVIAFCTVYGAIGSLSTAWALIDICMGLLTVCNLIAIALLSKKVFALLEDYRRQKAAGVREPSFRNGSVPELDEKFEGWR